jgi:glycosyltransferase involved in cell wall biosynthesis
VLAHLYEECRLFVEPSLYEGFWLPAAEAAVHGAAVITSSTSSLPEILNLPESQFDPASLNDIVRVMTQGLIDEEFRSRLLRAGEGVRKLHSWEAVVDRVLPRLEGTGRRVDVPVRNRQWYLDRGFPTNSIGRTIPTSNLDA